MKLQTAPVTDVGLSGGKGMTVRPYTAAVRHRRLVSRSPGMERHIRTTHANYTAWPAWASDD